LIATPELGLLINPLSQPKDAAIKLIQRHANHWRKISLKLLLKRSRKTKKIGRKRSSADLE
jgi:hypothetical protein